MHWHKKILGHRKNLEELERLAQSGQLPNAFLFLGPAQIGKFRIAKSFAQLLNGNDPLIAHDIERNICPDVITIGDLWQADKLEDWGMISRTSNFDQSHRAAGDSEGGKRSDTIGITDMRKFFEPFFQSKVASYKVGIIRDAERLTPEAANLALKTLEEPPADTVFVLTAAHEDKLPTTIVSRCQVMRFQLVPTATLATALDPLGLDESTKQTMLTLAQGRSEHLHRCIEDGAFFEKEKQAYQEISRYFFVQSLGDKAALAEELSKPENSVLMEEFIDNLTRFARSVLLEKIQQKTMPIVEQISYSELLHIFAVLHEVNFGLRANGNRRLLLERLCFAIP